MKYPEYIQVRNEKYKLDTSYLTAIECFRIISDDTISDTERGMALMQKLIGQVVLDQTSGEILTLLVQYLQRGRTAREVEEMMAIQGDEDPDIDYTQDFGYITASFISDYGIDLSSSTNDSMHWWKFVDLLNGCSPKSAIGRVRELRNMDPSDYKDPKAREQILKAQRLVALKPKLTESERQADDAFMSLLAGKGNKTEE
ncbi:Gp15 family bacteriophage protein [Stecheria intestinalis]|uniref:Gp15 family bacteriophage protein n=1 Tax=Stecheria intestinalis TaxID=2606630 RepID=UPI0023F2D693|nr:Gp15 family bacteriophage protein [Stecheria intestinalis]MDD5880979.1 Gp15 family bacteriophage protein [Stecheria intestinalis]